jgi:hypothetical protein
LRCKRPIGPLDEPTFPRDKYDIPTGFWEESAEEIFKSAKEIMDIVNANSKSWVSSESPQVAFAIWTAAFVGVYSRKFPYMDSAGHMNGENPNNDFRGSGETINDTTSLALKTLIEMSPRLKMAYGWSKTTKRMLEYFTRIIQDYNRNSSPLIRKHYSGSLSGEHALSLREGGSGGGLEEYKVVEKELKDFGSLEEEDRHSTPTASDITEYRASTSGPIMTPNIKAEALQSAERFPTARSATEATWAAVNNNGSADQGRQVSYSFNGAPQPSKSDVQDAANYHLQHHDQSSDSPSLMDDPQSSIDINSSYNQSELVHVPQTQSFYSSQPIIPGYPNSAQHSFGYETAGDSQDWAFDRHLSGVPAWDWPPEPHTNLYQTNLPATIQNALPYY